MSSSTKHHIQRLNSASTATRWVIICIRLVLTRAPVAGPSKMPALFAERAESWSSFSMASKAAPEVSLLCIAAHEGDGGSELLDCIFHGLTHPSVPLSAQAAAKLHKLSCSPHLAAGDLVKSLPVEVLYDDTGLGLFDQITCLSEYYLTEAEASILAKCGTDIVRCCVQDGSLLLELGAGSMRKTQLLLDAIKHVGCQDVTFAALDLCQQSLTEALTGLKGNCFGSSINLMGIVGTYDQGLDYISKLSQQHHRHQQQQQHVQQQYTAAPAGPEEEEDAEAGDLACGADSPTACRPHRQLSTTSTRTNSCSSGSNSNSNISTDAAIEIAAGDFLAKSSTEGVTAAAAAGVSDCGQQLQLPVGDAPRVILWLGSSIGNCSREEAAVFLRQVQEKAMRTGDFLLVGIDRRNDPEMVAAAYNDKQGVTRSFILNGLHHCSRLLDAARPEPNSNSTRPSSSSSSKGPSSLLSSTGPSSSVCEEPSLRPEDFDYFCLYNDDLGRHEAYYQAVVDTTINLPAAAAAANAGSPGPVIVNGGNLSVAVAAGEVISVEFSYKYSQQEVQQLAASAGLVRVKTWSDAQQRYDLHLLQCRG